MKWLGQECTCFLEPAEGLLGDLGHDNEAYEGSEVDPAEPVALDISGTYTVHGQLLADLYRALNVPDDIAARAARLSATVELTASPGRLECRTILGNKTFRTTIVDGARLEANGPEQYVLSFDDAHQCMGAGPHSLAYELTSAGLRVKISSNGLDCTAVFPLGRPRVQRLRRLQLSVAPCIGTTGPSSGTRLLVGYGCTRRGCWVFSHRFPPGMSGNLQTRFALKAPFTPEPGPRQAFLVIFPRLRRPLTSLPTLTHPTD